jgi:hypothetical protein
LQFLLVQEELIGGALSLSGLKIISLSNIFCFKQVNNNIFPE